MRVRPATPDDADAIAAVLAEVAAEDRWIATEPPVDVGERALAMRGALSGGERMWVLEEGEEQGRIVGTLGMHGTRTRGVLSLGMAVLAGSRGRGGGRLLLEAALAWLPESDAHKLELEVWTDNARAIALYARHGFEVEGLRRDHYLRRDGSLRSALIMARRL